MPITFLHTADWQLGKPFASVTDADKRSVLTQERVNAIGEIGAVARQAGAAFIVVAGDVFDTPTASKKWVSAACGAIGKIGLPVFAIPGNHDHGGPGCLWGQDFFLNERESLAPNFKILLSPEPVDIGEAILLPCPLLRRHESRDPTSWLREIDETVSAPFGNKPRIAIAHGSVQGFESAIESEDGHSGVANLIDADRIPAGLADYIALGDWHGTKQITARAWYSGTPEIDRFPKGPTNEPGNVLVVSLDRGSAPEVRVERTSRLRWRSIDFTFSNDSDVEELESKIRQITGDEVGRDLIQLSLSGSLGIEATSRLEAMLETWSARFLRVKQIGGYGVAPTDDEIQALTRRAGDPLIARVASILISELSQGGDASLAANAALRQLHAAIKSLTPPTQ
ncbi:MAG: DNA repair exonuclease [Verrucomicrobiales bacterium]